MTARLGSMTCILLLTSALVAQPPTEEGGTEAVDGAEVRTLAEVGAEYRSSRKLLVDSRFGLSVKFPSKPKCIIIRQKGELIAPPQVKSYEVTYNGIDYIVGGVRLPKSMRGEVGKSVTPQQVVDGMRKKMLAASDQFRRIFNKEIKVGDYEGREEVILLQQTKVDGKLHDRAVMYSRTLVTRKRVFTAQATIGEDTYSQDKEGYKATMIDFLQSLKVEPPDSLEPAVSVDGPGG